LPTWPSFRAALAAATPGPETFFLDELTVAGNLSVVQHLPELLFGIGAYALYSCTPLAAVRRARVFRALRVAQGAEAFHLLRQNLLDALSLWCAELQSFGKQFRLPLSARLAAPSLLDSPLFFALPIHSIQDSAHCHLEGWIFRIQHRLHAVALLRRFVTCPAVAVRTPLVQRARVLSQRIGRLTPAFHRPELALQRIHAFCQIVQSAFGGDLGLLCRAWVGTHERPASQSSCHTPQQRSTDDEDDRARLELCHALELLQRQAAPSSGRVYRLVS